MTLWTLAALVWTDGPAAYEQVEILAMFRDAKATLKVRIVPLVSD